MLKLIMLGLLFVTFSVFAEKSTIICPINVRIISTSTQDLAQLGLAGGVATFDTNGNRIIKYDAQLESTPEMMNHVVAHECAHHVLGHLDRPSIRNYYAKEQLQEHPADCLAADMLVEQLGYGKKEFKVIESFLEHHTDKTRAGRVMECIK